MEIIVLSEYKQASGCHSHAASAENSGYLCSIQRFSHRICKYQSIFFNVNKKLTALVFLLMPID